MSEGIQITIPDFDDDNVLSAPTGFGRLGFGFGGSFGGGFGGSSSGLDSPSGTTTPLSAFQSSDRGFFSHSRGDSSASADSTGSATTRYASKPSTPFSHSAQPSFATTTTGFPRKASFASIRNAFKSGKSNDAPPMPPLEHSPYPALKNPFNRSTSSLNQVAPSMGRSMTSTPSSGMRPPTPGSNDVRSGRGVKTRGHGVSKSSGSIFNASDAGSDYYPPSPPPVPRVPTAYQDVDDDKVVMDPKTPSDYALHAVFIRFATSAEEKIDHFVRQPLDQETLLTTVMGPGIDPKFDDNLHSLGVIAQKHAKKVIDSVMRWRRSQSENAGSEMGASRITLNGGLGRKDIPAIVNERKSLAAIYIMCRALVAILQLLSRDAFGDALGHNLEETTFEQFKRPDLKSLAQSPNRRINSELYATLLGHLANVRFMSVTDRFLAELGPVALGQVSKEMGTRYENLVKGLKHIKIKVWPPEAFEEGAEFMEELSKSYANAHGHLKIAFAETLIMLLHPIGKTAQAETNNPQWGKAIETICPKAREMMGKPRYWQVAFPLAVTALCMGPQTYFLRHWQGFFETSISKLKERPYRTVVLNGLLRLVWTYLYRCQEAASTTMTKLEALLKHFFPANRTTVFPPDDQPEPLIYIMHFILSRHPDYGRELCLELMQEPIINNLQKSGNVGTLAPERTLIAIRAVLLSTHNTEREVLTPTWPSGADFSTVPTKDDYPSSSEYLSPNIIKPGAQEFLNRCASVLSTIAVHCNSSVGNMSVFDEQWSHAKVAPAYEDSSNFIVRRHAEGIIIAYPIQSSPHISLLQTCFQSWPRLLHPSLPLSDVIDMLLRGIVHVEPAIMDAAGVSLKRIMNDDVNAIQVISQFNIFLFSPNRICHESGFKLHIEYPPLLTLWVEIVADWINTIIHRGLEACPQTEQVIARCLEIEAASLFLLSHCLWTINSSGVKIIRLLGRLAPLISSYSDSDTLYIVERLQSKASNELYLNGYDDLLDKSEQSRLDQWRKFKGAEVALRIVDSPNEKDRKLWRYVYPAFLQDCAKYSGTSVNVLREGIIAAVLRYHPSISYLAGLSTSKSPPGLSSRNILDRDGGKLIAENKPFVDQWHLWIKILCSTAAPPDSTRPAFTKLGRDHTRAPSDVSFERERYMTTRGLFRHLTPFLDSEYTLFRDAAVLCISSFPPNSYPQLLEDLALLAGRQPYEDARSKPVTTPALEQNFSILTSRQVYDDGKSKFNNSTMLTERNRRQERLNSAVARIYSLTAHLLQQQRSSARQAALLHILKFVRNTQIFLCAPDMRENPSLHRLRRYFCGIVEQFFNELATLKDSDRFIPSHMHLTLYRLCEEWCQVGPQSESTKQRNAEMQMSVENTNTQPDSVQRFRHDASLLSQASVGALASLCRKALFPPDQAAASPTERYPTELMKHLTVPSVLDRLSAIMTTSQESTKVKGKATLKSLLTHEETINELNHEVLRRAIVVMDKPGSSNHHFFEVVSDIVVNERQKKFTFAQIVCLSLTNLRHPSSTVRCLAFDTLEAVHHQHSGLLAMSNFEAFVTSLAPSTYIHAHRSISDFLAGEHPQQAVSMLAQLGNWLPQLPGEAYDTNVILLLLQSLEFWIPNINLMTDDKSSVSMKGLSCLYHLTSLTLQYGQSHAEQILVLWTKLVEPPQYSNGHATVRFLLEQAHKVGSVQFVKCASNIVASLCQTPIGRQVFEDLCSVIEPIHMLPAIEHKLVFPQGLDMKLWEDLDALFGEHPRLSLGSAQFAWLFLSDVTLQRSWEMLEQLPTLLHAVFTHLDHRILFVRQRARAMLFQLLRSWTPGYDELPERSPSRSRSSVKYSIAALEKETDLYWEEEDPSDEAVPKMKLLSSRILSFLEPLAPHLISQWGSLALEWGTACSIRATAFRSLQTFRALMPRVKKADLALLLGRLSNTVAASEENIQSFTSEIFLTLNAVANSSDLDKSLLPQIFWCACACLTTTVEQEFGRTVQLIESLLTRIDLDDSATIDQLLSHKPANWKESSFLQPPLLRGLRSSVVSSATMKVLQTLLRVQDSQLIDRSEGRLRDVYTISLPWCLHAMDQPENTLKGFAEDISILAARENRHSIQKIMNSFAKGHFRTRDDFLRQSVASLREHYGAQHWTQVVTLLLGLVLNNERWLRVHAMQVLKVLFQHRETRDPVELLGSELLMPLLRLLETDLAPQALDVLEEPMVMSGSGPAAKHVLRMSMHVGTVLSLPSSDPDSATVVFGVPAESGWCVPQADVLRETCQANVMAVFDTCSVPTRPSRIQFEPEVEALQSIKTPLADDLNGPMQSIHEITTFFDNGVSFKPNGRVISSIPTRRLEARVAAILAKSTAPDSITDTPQTPFLDVFNVAEIDHPEDSDDYSDSDSDGDAFVFDSLYSHRSAPNGARYI